MSGAGRSTRSTTAKRSLAEVDPSSSDDDLLTPMSSPKIPPTAELHKRPRVEDEHKLDTVLPSPTSTATGPAADASVQITPSSLSTPSTTPTIKPPESMASVVEISSPVVVADGMPTPASKGKATALSESFRVLNQLSSQLTRSNSDDVIGKDPISIMDNLRTLDAANVVSTSINRDGELIFYGIKTSMFERAFGNEDTVRRLNAFAVYRGNDKCTNLAMADPAHLKITNKNFLASPVTPLKPGLFYSVGIATLSKLFDVQADTRTRARQLCVAVSDVSWPRAMAVATSAFKAVEYINLSTFSHGVSFSTRLKPALDKENNSSAPIAGISGSQSPSPGKAGYNVSVPILPWNAEVAVFDGRQKFTFAQYQNLPRRHEEIPVGSAVMVFFTLHTYQRGGTCLSLNLQHVVMLALPEASQRDEADMPPERIIMPGVKEPVAAAVLLELGSDDDVFAM